MQLHNHSPEQQAILQQLANQLAAELLQVNFSDPANDEQTIRYHAYMRGKFELVSQLLADNYPDPEPQESNPVDAVSDLQTNRF